LNFAVTRCSLIDPPVMSGVEIAGFVLAAFPLLISAGEHYREGFEPLVKWKKFRTDFISFIN